VGKIDSNSRLTIYVDGASRGNPGPSGIGIVIEDREGATKVKISGYIGRTTNNQAEYRALIVGLREAARLKAEHVDIMSDSELLVEQVCGRYKVRSAQLRNLFEEVKELLAGFRSSAISYIPREQNRVADALANQAFDGQLRR
jgi:ribonuclease HI